MPLADLQQRMRDAVVNGDSASISPLLVGGRDAAKRLAIHGHHYEASLTAAVVDRFPATAWLIGPRRLEHAARRFVHRFPPKAPCIAEYGSHFPAFLAAWPGTAPLSYVPEFADLDWHLGRLAVSIDIAAVGLERLAAINPNALADMTVSLQPGTHYVCARWPIDQLIGMYLADRSAESWTLIDEDVHLQVRGARGAFRFSRLGAGEYVFRTSLAEGHSVGDATCRAVEGDRSFDPGRGFLALVDEQLITSLCGPQERGGL